MQAVVICDKYDAEHDLKLLRTELAALEISLFVFPSVAQLEKSLFQLKNEPTLYYPNPWVRYELPKEILKFHHENRGFESLCVGNECVTYYPKNFANRNDTIINAPQLRMEIGSRFVISTIKKYIVKPAVEPLRIFVNANVRDTYFKLSFASLKNSLNGDEKITILLNEPSEAVRKEALIHAQLENVDVLEIEKNCFYSSLNLGLQWYGKPSKFMMYEDDFILPSTVKTLYPNWVHQFTQRLDDFDFVGWAPTVDNAPLHHRFPRHAVKPFGGWEYQDELHPLLLGQGLAMRFDYWLETLKKETDHWFTPLDSKLHKYAKNYCTPTLKGYHIGWNQEMDGYGSLWRPEFTPPPVNIVKNLKTGESREMKLENILS